jgi:hypothetical protein
LDYLKEEYLNLLSHQPYSPGLSLCDYWLTDYIMRNLTDKNDGNFLFKEVTRIGKKYSGRKRKITVSKLQLGLELCIKNSGEYFEHLME